MTRSRGLDAFRGAAIAGMIVVNYASPIRGCPAFLRHAPWHGFTAADLVFPAFLVIVGVALALRQPPWPKVVRRSIGLFALGVAINAFPFVEWHSVTIMGALERIGLCYCLAALCAYYLSPRGVIALCIAILAGYWALLGGDYDIATALPGRIDRAVFGASHLNPDYTPPFDPEGLLATLPALVTVLGGVLAARWLAEPRKLAFAGVPLVVAGLLLGQLVPINKPLWTPSFTLLTLGLSFELLAVFVLWSPRPLVWLGRRPLRIYVVATLVKGVLVYSGVLGG